MILSIRDQANATSSLLLRPFLYDFHFLRRNCCTKQRRGNCSTETKELRFVLAPSLLRSLPFTYYFLHSIPIACLTCRTSPNIENLGFAMRPNTLPIQPRIANRPKSSNTLKITLINTGNYTLVLRTFCLLLQLMPLMLTERTEHSHRNSSSGRTCQIATSLRCARMVCRWVPSLAVANNAN